MNNVREDLKAYYDRFETDETQVLGIISEALSKGGEYCDIFFQQSGGVEIALQDHIVGRASAAASIGVGIRVLKDDRTGYAYTEQLTPEALTAAAKTAAKIASGGRRIPPVKIIHKPGSDLYPVDILPEHMQTDVIVNHLTDVDARIFDADSRIVKSNVRFSGYGSYILVITSEGRAYCDYRPMVQQSASCVAELNGKREGNGFALSARRGMEYITPESGRELADEAVRRTVALFDAVKPGGGEMEIVLAAGTSGILLHEAIGHGLEADFNRKRISIFTDMMNQKIAESFVGIVDDGTIPHDRGAINMDDEGNPSERTVLVEKGVLKSYLHDRISALHYKTAFTGNGRRESFRCAPIPRMRNTYMLPGPHAPEEIIESVKKGVYAHSFTNGAVSIGAGDFTFYIKSGELIENGKLTRPIKDVNIIGNGPEVLKNIVMAGNDLKMADGGWTCGKNGQSVPVSMGLPTVKISKITVGGADPSRQKETP